MPNESLKEEKMETRENIIKAPELRVEQWIDGSGKTIEPIKLSNYKGKYKIIYCFQHWCPGCHSVGLPSLKKLVDTFDGNDKIAFFAVQTVFEGSHANTYEKISETQKKYDLKIPFGHDPGKGRSTIMEDYGTGGTPWFIFIDQEDNIVFADFHINTEGTINYLNEILK
jgi:thiol-disulfide isomerase/thioredoxin